MKKRYWSCSSVFCFFFGVPFEDCCSVEGSRTAINAWEKKRAFEHQNKKCDNLSNVCHLDTKGMVGSQNPSRSK